MKRILLLATVAALIAVMLVVSVAPVWAHNVTCVGGQFVGRYPASAEPSADEDNDGVICGRTKHDGTIVYRDDHGFPNGH